MVVSSIPSARRTELVRYGFAILTNFLALLFTWLLLPITSQAPFLCFSAAVVVSALYGGWKPMLLVIVLGILTIGYFFIPPAFSLAMGLEGILELGAFAIVAGVTGFLAERHHRTERIVREQGEQLRVTLASIGDAVIVTDTVGSITFINPMAEALTGWTAADAIGKPATAVFRIVNAATRAVVESPITHVLREGTMAGLTNHTVLLAKDGTERPIDDSGAPVRAIDGSLTGVVLVFRDVTERKRADEAVRAARDQLDVILHGVADGITAQNITGQLIYVNDAAAQLSGFPSAEAMLTAPLTTILERFEMLNEAGEPFPPAQLPGRQALRGVTSPEALIRFRNRATGEERWLLVKATAVRDPSGHGQLAINILQDVTARRQAEEDQIRLLANDQAASAAAARAQLEAVLERITDAVFVVDRDWRYTYVNTQATRMTRKTHEELIGNRVWEVFPDTVGGLSDRELHRAVLEQGPVAFENYNARLNIWGETRAYPSAEGLTIFTRDITIQKQSEQVAQRAAVRTARLQTVTAALVGALTPGEIAAVVLREGLAAVDGNAGSITLLTPTGDALEILHAVGYPAEVIDQYRRISAIEASPEADAVRSDAPIFLESRAVAAAGWPYLAEVHAVIPWQAWANVPLLVNGHAIGNLNLAFLQEQAFDPEVRGFLLTLAQQCSQALERARLYEAERQARTHAERIQRRVSFLADVTTRLTVSLEYTTRLQQLAHLVVPTLADFCEVYVQQANGWITRMAVAHGDQVQEAQLQVLEAQEPIDPDGPDPIAQVLRSGEAEIVLEVSSDDGPLDTQGPAQQQTDQQPQAHAYMLFPLVARNQIIGAMSFMLTDPARAYSDEDVTFAAEVARRAALALDNARLYRDAQDAIQLRDQFLSVAAHELKTPLTSLLGNAQLIQRRDRRDNLLRPQERRNVEVIVNQANRLNAMILSLLDVSRMEAGQLSIQRERLDLCALVRRIVDEAASSLENSALDLSCPDEVVLVNGDALRLEQVFQNLIQNAVKYSAPLEPIIIEVVQRDTMVTVAFCDQGIGIPSEAISRLFQRFFRASNVNATNVVGMGIGLYVVREIVTLHGGTVEVVSTEGVGSTFTVALPLAQTSSN